MTATITRFRLEARSLPRLAGRAALVAAVALALSACSNGRGKARAHADLAASKVTTIGVHS